MIEFDVIPTNNLGFEEYIDFQKSILASNPALNIFFEYDVTPPTELAKFLYHFKIQLNFPPIYYIGYYLVLPTFLGGFFLGWWFLIILPAIFIASRIFWTTNFYVWALRTGLKRQGYVGDIVVMTQTCQILDKNVSNGT